MNGTKPVFLRDKKLPSTYYESPNPYQNAPSCNVNLLLLSRYAKKIKKAISQLTAEEMERFLLNK